MANEIKLTAQFALTNSNSKYTFQPGQQSIDQAAVGGPSPGTLSIGTSEETITPSEISSKGWCIVQNLDTTNYVQMGFSTGVYGIRLNPGEYAMFRLEPGVTDLYFKADTNPCKIQLDVFED